MNFAPVPPIVKSGTTEICDCNLASLGGNAHDAPMLRISLLLLCASSLLSAREFEVMVYNVENLFDHDGIAEFSDYRPNSPVNPYGYSRKHVLRKLEAVANTLATVNQGAGPEVVLFQEFELDRSPESTVEDPAAFLRQTADRSVAELLASGDSRFTGLPSWALVLKTLHDRGMTGYHVALPETGPELSHEPAHQNAVFSKFPVLYTRSYPTEKARTILEAGLDVEGKRLIVFNNHWKSGASRPGTEDIRVANARDLLKAVLEVVERDPLADVIVGGDLNTYYNAPEYFADKADWENTDTFAIEVLGPQHQEHAMTRLDGPLFYNLWHELPEDQRGSELYRGKWGTLMQILLTRGLYHKSGVRYVDGSFQVVRLPGENTAGPFAQPRGWHFSDGGGGYSDHFPIMATFSSSESAASAFMELDEPNQAPPPATLPSVNYAAIDPAELPRTEELAGKPLNAWMKRSGELFLVEGKVVTYEPMVIRTGGEYFGLYAWDQETSNALKHFRPGDSIILIGELGRYRGEKQFVIQDISWVSPL